MKSDKRRKLFVESPQQVFIQTPEFLFIGMSHDFSCSTASVRPLPRLIWTVTDFESRELELPGDIKTEEEAGGVSSRLTLTPPSSARSLNVHCRAENRVGYTEDTKTIDLTCNQKNVLVSISLYVQL